MHLETVTSGGDGRTSIRIPADRNGDAVPSAGEEDDGSTREIEWVLRRCRSRDGVGAVETPNSRYRVRWSVANDELTAQGERSKGDRSP